jgi:hypothetical protein
MSAPIGTCLNRDHHSIVKYNTSRGLTVPPYRDTRTWSLLKSSGGAETGPRTLAE